MKSMRIAAALGATLVVGVMSGATLVGEPRIQAPHACTVALNLGDRYAVTQSNLVSAVAERGDALGKEDYAEADTKVAELLDELDAIAPDYETAADECLGEPPADPRPTASSTPEADQ